MKRGNREALMLAAAGLGGLVAARALVRGRGGYELAGKTV